MSLSHSTTTGAARGYPRRMGKTPNRATYEDLLALDEQTRAEVVEGRVTTVVAPVAEHGRTQACLASAIGSPFDHGPQAKGPGGWWIACDVDVRFAPTTVLRPDLVGWRRERLRTLRGRPIEVRPDWVCEVVSPSNASHDLVTKRRLYAAHGVPHYWLVEPLARTLTALTLQDDRWVEEGVFDEHDVARIAPFEAVELEVGRLFLPRDESEAEVEASPHEVDLAIGVESPATPSNP